MSFEDSGTSRTLSEIPLGKGSGSSVTKTSKTLRLRRSPVRTSSDKKLSDDEFMAAAIGDVEWLKQSLRDAGGKLNYDKNGLTALHLSAIHGRLDCLKVCIEKFKMDVNLPSSTGWRAIHLVISNQTGKRALQCLTYLLEKHPDLSMCNEDGITPAHQAASEGHVQCLKLLIENGANVQAKDCRGNTPLDLAKLWGHRKCARILAAEIWHQDKEHVAKELLQLKKLKMQQVLQEIENDEEFQAIREAQTEKAFQQFVKDRKLEAKPTGLHLRADDQQGIYKANSIASEYISKVSTEMREKSTTPSSRRELTSSDLLDDMQHESDREDTSRSKEKESKMTPAKSSLKSSEVSHPNPWIKYSKLNEKEYVPILKDLYPRDEYTMMPKLKFAPKYFTGKFEQVITLSDLEDSKSMVLKKLRKPDLPNDLLEKELARDPSVSERPVVFKPKIICDVLTKRKYDQDVISPVEAPLHLSNNVRSFLIRNNFKFCKNDSESSSKSGSPDFDPFLHDQLASTLKQMSKRDHFPNIQGKEYVLRCGEMN